jgi:hypothetical protein
LSLKRAGIRADNKERDYRWNLHKWFSPPISEKEVDSMPQQGQRHNDEQAHVRALEHLATVAGAECAARVCWDLVHHLQGHVDVAGRHVVLIAPRDDEHEPLVLTEAEWDALRHRCLVAA